MSGDRIPIPGDYSVGEWLRGEGDDADVAVCTRVRFARNVQDYRFSTSMPNEEAAKLTEFLVAQLTQPGLREELRVRQVSELAELERRELLERHLISRELATAERPRAVAVNDRESVSVMVNEEDHIRTQVFACGHDIPEAYRRAEALDEQLMERVQFAFNEEFGFLTACPTNAGTGLRVSVMLHLPGLVWAEEIEKATTAAQKTNMAVRGLYGEGSRATGDFYQVSNQITLGRTEDQITGDVSSAVRSLVAWERKIRGALLSGEPRSRTLDRIYRALGTLERAHVLATEEALGCLSAVRFGVRQGLLAAPSIAKLNLALLLSQPAHLQRLCGGPLSAAERDERRATLIRQLVADD
ncbi:MAG: ATP--guanido phosphotransferase [Planctomycetota bacterium]